MNALVFLAGFLLAYFTLLAIRSAMGRMFILLILCGLTSEAAINMRGRIVNTGSVTIWVDAHAVYNASNSDWPALNGSIAAGDDLPIDGSWAVLNNATATTGEWRVRYSTVGSTGPWTDFLDNVSPSFSSSASFQDYIMYLPAPYSYTNHVVTNACVTNFFATAANFWLEITEGGTTEIAGPHYLQPGEIYCTPAFTNHQAVSLQWVAYQNNDGFSAPTPVGDPTESTPQVESSETPDADIPPAIAEGSKDPFGDIPARENISTNEAVAARQNSEGIVRAIGESSDRQTAALSNVFVGLGLGNLSSLTNLQNTNDYTAILQTISSNTAASTNLQRHLTNLAPANAMFSNVVDQMSGAAQNIMTNDSGLLEQLGFLEDGENAINGTLINQEVSGASSSLRFDFTGASGTAMELNLDPIDSTGDSAITAALKTKLIKFMNFLRDWILKLIPFVMFWACFSLCNQWFKDLNEATLAVAKAPNLSPTKLGGALVGFLVAGVLSVLIGFFPTLIIARFESISLSGAIPSIAGHLEEWSAGEGGDMASRSIRFFEFLGEAVPFTTVVSSAAIYMAFRSFGEKLYLIALGLIRGFGFVAPGCILLLALETQAASVRVINLDTNTITWTNSSRSLAFPQGETVLNIEDESWGCTGIEIDLDAQENEVVYRFSRDSLGQLVADRAIDEGSWSWFWSGYKLGFIVFGLSMVVRWVRAGLGAPARYSLSD